MKMIEAVVIKFKAFFPPTRVVTQNSLKYLENLSATFGVSWSFASAWRATCLYLSTEKSQESENMTKRNLKETKNQKQKIEP